MVAVTCSPDEGALSNFWISWQAVIFQLSFVEHYRSLIVYHGEGRVFQHIKVGTRAYRRRVSLLWGVARQINRAFALFPLKQSTNPAVYVFFAGRLMSPPDVHILVLPSIWSDIPTNCVAMVPWDWHCTLENSMKDRLTRPAAQYFGAPYCVSVLMPACGLLALAFHT